MAEVTFTAEEVAGFPQGPPGPKGDPGSGGSSVGFNVRDFGAVGDGVADDTSAIQAAINAVPSPNAQAGLQAGGSVYLPPTQNGYKISDSLRLRSSMSLVGGAIWPYHATGSSIRAAPGMNVPLLTGDPTARWVTLSNLNLEGSGAVNGNKGIYSSYAVNWILKNLEIWNCGGQGVHLVSGGICHISQVRCINCVSYQTGISAFTGAMQLGIHDSYVEFVELAPKTPADFGSGYIAGFVQDGVGGTNNLYSVVAEFGQRGFVFAGSTGVNVVHACRADFSIGGGFYVSSNRNMLTNCHTVNGPTGAVGAHSDFYTTGWANDYVSCSSVPGGALRTKYSFEDVNALAGEQRVNTYMNCRGREYATGEFGWSGAQAPMIASRSGNHLKSVSGGFKVGGVSGQGFLEFTNEQTDVAAPAANGLRLFTKDDGTGKTQLWAKGATGSATLVATTGAP